MDKDLPNIKRWVVIYPVYINSKKTVAEGRRISVEKACESPTCAEIGDCCSHFKLPFAIEVCNHYICTICILEFMHTESQQWV